MRIEDSFHAANDPKLPTVRLALDSCLIKAEFKRGLPRIAGARGTVEVKSATVLRYKPGRRCVIEYDVRVRHQEADPEKTKLIGKIRAGRFGREGYRLLDSIWGAGFERKAKDRISVPEPAGFIPEFRMWLQRRVPGTESTDLFLKGSNEAHLYARKIAEAAHKIHSLELEAEREHRLVDELQILHERLPLAGQLRPELIPRISRLIQGCDRLAKRVPETELRGIHRDFYPAQVIIHRDRLYLLDFDLFCRGDPALDIGNFIGHLTELSLRTFGDAGKLQRTEQILEESFLELSGEHRRAAVQAYTILTLARHVYLSTQFVERIKFTEPLLNLCESRLTSAGCL